ncbi:MAG TPA: hypothetical protein VHW02_07560 [Rhizomicrobium sp.]|nr:hypothetical protein [Rhizomicrobium sp.]
MGIDESVVGIFILALDQPPDENANEDCYHHYGGGYPKPGLLKDAWLFLFFVVCAVIVAVAFTAVAIIIAALAAPRPALIPTVVFAVPLRRFRCHPHTKWRGQKAPPRTLTQRLQGKFPSKSPLGMPYSRASFAAKGAEPEPHGIVMSALQHSGKQA